jgi:flagellar biosynthetic protein FliP
VTVNAHCPDATERTACPVADRQPADQHFVPASRRIGAWVLAVCLTAAAPACLARAQSGGGAGEFGLPTGSAAQDGAVAPGVDTRVETLTADPEVAGDETTAIPTMDDLLRIVEKGEGDGSDAGREWSAPVKMALVFAGLAIVPSLLVMVTSFTRIVIVLSFARRALTTQTIPPTTAVIGLAVFLTLFTMAPTLTQVNAEAVQPYLEEQINFSKACERASDVMKQFVLRQTRQRDLELFVSIAGLEQMPETAEQVPAHIAIPSFAISEFRTAFEMGCMLFIPFLLVDLVVAGILLSTGMMMLPPSMISMPLKIILFVLVDGWSMLARTLVTSFH